MKFSFPRPVRPSLATSAPVVLLAMLAACGSSSSPSSSTVVDRGPKATTTLTRADATPTITIAITGLSGASGIDGSFAVGDRVSVTFTIKKTDGKFWRADDFALGRVLLSGPTSNYQRVIPEQTDLLTAAVSNADGSYTYTFPTPIPTTYAAPLNDTTSLAGLDGELTGQNLLAGTYTVGMYVYWNYTVDGTAYRESGNATYDFRFGGAPTLAPREVVKQDNCNQCHVSLRAHGGIRRDVKLCVLCHTSGAEDKNVATVENGTPGATIDFRVMIHKIHNGAHLPSVLGVAAQADGTRSYLATPKPYKLVGFNDTVTDFSEVAFPAWPDALIAMPRNRGYTDLSANDKITDDKIRTGVVNCTVCHGDPDGSGPLTAPVQGRVVYAQATQRACGSCHDDIDWTKPYQKNGSTMPLQADDSACMLCHGTTDQLGIEKAHTHPLRDATFNTGVVVKTTNVAEAGTANGDGTIDPGEKIRVTFAITDDAGNAVAPSSLASVSAVVSGPTTNSNLLLNIGIPTAALSAGPSTTLNLPQIRFLEFVGTSTAATNETFTTALTPHWDLTGAATSVWVQTAVSGGSSTLSAAIAAQTNYVDVVDATGFARNDYVVIDAGVSGKTEYLQIQYVDGKRLWFGSTASTGYAPGTTVAHSAGASVAEVVLTAKTKTTDFTLDKVSGQITEVTEFGTNLPVIVSYTTDFVMPSVYPLALNESPTLDATTGKWTGKAIADGTYTVTLWASKNVNLVLQGETNAYRATAEASGLDFLVGSATTVVPYATIASDAGCVSCHQDLSFHGGSRRGFAACIACHGTAGAEDRPKYVAGNAPATSGTTITFRTMLHKIHSGAELANAATYSLVGFGAGAWPNNYGVTSFADVEFPALPGGVLECTKCHGATNETWFAPTTRVHPNTTTLPVYGWSAACGACHDSDAAQAHIAIQRSTANGEACTLCHGTKKEWDVKLYHGKGR